MTKNTVRAKGVTGIYKGKCIELKIGSGFHNSSLKINGKKVSNCQGAWIKIVPDRPTILFLEFFKVPK